LSVRPFVTGGAGFSGTHVLEVLRSRGQDPMAPDHDELELLDASAVRAAVREATPTAVYHLAAQASVAASWEDPRTTLVENLECTLNVLEAVRAEAPEATVVVAGSGEIYGAPESLPVEETALVRPQNPYAVSKAACDLLAGQFADAHGMRIIRTRTFNQAGPGQSDEYVIGTIARQLAEAELGGAEVATIRVGNIDSRRDVTDVRDVARAYVDAVDAGAPAGAYNLCSGRSVSVRDLLDLLAAAASVKVRHVVDPARVRASDVPEIRGSNERIRAAVGWQPQISLEQTVADALESWRERLTAARAGTG
jgi:GDP-4-dehydro-6-deoxy-D-mannose reductase